MVTALVAIDEEDALDRVSNGQMSVDLLLINVVGKSVEDTLQMGRRIREQAKLDGNTPLIVMAEKYRKDLPASAIGQPRIKVLRLIFWASPLSRVALPSDHRCVNSNGGRADMLASR